MLPLALVKRQARQKSLADSDLAALNAALQKVVAERIHAQELWEQANDSDGIGLPQILDDKAISTLRQATRHFDG